MSMIREPAVAGLFYEGEASSLSGQVDGMLAEAHTKARSVPPKALIVPHAGHIYSGPIAASAYALLRGCAKNIQRVVLLGPSHRVGFIGLADSGARAFRTPLGDIPLDREAISAIDGLPQVHHLEQAHQLEHSLEVQLPFLQRLLGEFTLVPLVVGDAAPDEVAEVLERLWGGPETLIVISTDLSHYHHYDEAQRRDGATAEAITGLHPEAIGYDEACGRNPLNGLLSLARQHGLHIEQLDLRNSGDTAGDRDRVVGYGAFALYEDGEASDVRH